MTATARALAGTLARDLGVIFAKRLRSVVVYGAHAGDAADGPVHCLALAEGLSFDDVDACARVAGGWTRRGLATPILLDPGELARSLDAFPIEFGAMLARYVVVHGADPFAGLDVDPADVRRACEVQVRSHLLHLREGYLESGGVPTGIAALVERSAGPLAVLLANLARLAGADAGSRDAMAAFAASVTDTPATVFADVLAGGGGDAARLFPTYLHAVEQLADYVDRWSHRA